jgi:4-hydroxy-tetrahydrodipicolinate synthase
MIGINELKGIFTPVITPFKDNAIDEQAFERIIEQQINAGVHGLIIAGTTGEFSTLTMDEVNYLTEFGFKKVAKRIPVVATTGTNCTSDTIKRSQAAEKIGADAIMVVVPYYSKPSQNGLYQHFKAVSESVTLPIILYNNPGRAVAQLTNETIVKLATDFNNIIGIKDSTCDLTRPLELKETLKQPFAQLAGEDTLALAFFASGGAGWVAATANVAPKLCVQLYDLWCARKIDEAIELQARLMNLYRALFVETNPVGVKYAMTLLGLGTVEVRLPLTAIAEENKNRIKEILSKLDICK